MPYFDWKEQPWKNEEWKNQPWKENKWSDVDEPAISKQASRGISSSDEDYSDIFNIIIEKKEEKWESRFINNFKLAIKVVACSIPDEMKRIADFLREANKKINIDIFYDQPVGSVKGLMGTVEGQEGHVGAHTLTDYDNESYFNVYDIQKTKSGVPIDAKVSVTPIDPAHIDILNKISPPNINQLPDIDYIIANPDIVLFLHPNYDTPANKAQTLSADNIAATPDIWEKVVYKVNVNSDDDVENVVTKYPISIDIKFNRFSNTNDVKGGISKNLTHELGHLYFDLFEKYKYIKWTHLKIKCKEAIKSYGSGHSPNDPGGKMADEMGGKYREACNFKY